MRGVVGMGKSRNGWRTLVSAAVVLALTATGTATGQPASAAPVERAGITVDAANPAGRLPSDFVGLSYEMRELYTGGFDARRGNLVPLFRTLGKSNLRISGNTLDRDTLWVPEGTQPPQPLPEWVQSIVTPADIRRLNKFLVATGWKTEIGINVGRWDPVLGADQARAMFSILGRRLLAAECGNEPDQWVLRGYRPAGYAYADYLKDWRTCADAIGNDRIAGPDAASPTTSWAASLARDERARLKMLMIHFYSLAPDGTLAGLLSPQTRDRQLSAVTPNLTAAKAANLPLRIDETNSAFGGGVPGVSDVYGSALWGLDYSLAMAQAGVAGINLHGGLGVCGAPLFNGRFQRYTPVCAADKADEQARIYKAMPLYYGLWMATRLGPGRFLPVTLSTDRNITAYAVRGDDGRTRLVVVQKEETSTAPVRLDITVGGRNRGAEVLRLTGATLGGSDVAIQGAQVDRRGKLKPGRADRAKVRDGVLSVNLTGGSAVLITLDKAGRGHG